MLFYNDTRYLVNNLNYYINPENDPFNPHLSLYYGYVSTEEKTNYMKKIALPEDEFIANKLYFVHNNEEECKWTVLDERFLPVCSSYGS